MDNKNTKLALINIISNVILQAVNILTWFIIPKLILDYFGSEINGLVSSITQFISYISLVDGGISGVVIASLYKPLVNNDVDKISSIVKTSDKFFKKIGFVFVLYALLLAIIYPLVFTTSYSFIYVSSLVIILSLSMFIQYMFSLSLKNLLIADKRGYIVSLSQSVILILTIVLSYISLIIFPSIHLLKLLSGALFIIQPLIFSVFIKKHYNLNNNVNIDNTLIKERWNGFAVNIAAFIHNCTDIVVLTIFTNLATVSIYSVYTIVTNGLRSIINAISSAIGPIVGHAYAKGNTKELMEKIDVYEYIILIFVFFSFSIAALLITPFVMIYTKGIIDANYYQPVFGVLIVIAEALYLLKFPHLNLAYSANKYRELTIPSILEACINIIISIILVLRYGLIGVTIGTILAMLYRMIYQIYFSTKLISNWKQFSYYKKILSFILPVGIGFYICMYLFPITSFDLLSWLISAIEYGLIFGVLLLINSLIFFRKELKFIIKYLFSR